MPFKRLSLSVSRPLILSALKVKIIRANAFKLTAESWLVSPHSKRRLQNRTKSFMTENDHESLEFGSHALDGGDLQMQYRNMIPIRSD